MGQKSSVSCWLMVIDVSMGVGLDGQPNQGKGVIGNGDITVSKTELSIPQ
ncbi:hypothetical protein SDC9_67167 [bioreactor metagenome]|uniref:Uncharacterized protein n=1 Tax=bioreactor metagenome TaxID=1076179 RepID=A0A644XYL3_9ZZZZ